MSEKDQEGRKEGEGYTVADAAVDTGGCLFFEGLGCALSAITIVLVPVLVRLS